MILCGVSTPQPTVCERELCVFAFQTLGVMNEAADEIATGAQVVDLLVSMCRSALESPRKVVIFEPYPSVVDPCDSQALAFNPRVWFTNPEPTNRPSTPGYGLLTLNLLTGLQPQGMVY
eukprot:XP_014045038.1 PREDICTED: poly [ADP-ribose] polymerase 8-like [Salmo salar]